MKPCFILTILIPLSVFARALGRTEQRDGELQRRKELNEYEIQDFDDTHSSLSTAEHHQIQARNDKPKLTLWWSIEVYDIYWFIDCGEDINPYYRRYGDNPTTIAETLLRNLKKDFPKRFSHDLKYAESVSYTRQRGSNFGIKLKSRTVPDDRARDNLADWITNILKKYFADEGVEVRVERITSAYNPPPPDLPSSAMEQSIQSQIKIRYLAKTMQNQYLFRWIGKMRVQDDLNAEDLQLKINSIAREPLLKEGEELYFGEMAVGGHFEFIPGTKKPKVVDGTVNVGCDYRFFRLDERRATLAANENRKRIINFFKEKKFEITSRENLADLPHAEINSEKCYQKRQEEGQCNQLTKLSSDSSVCKRSGEVKEAWRDFVPGEPTFNENRAWFACAK